MSDQKIIIIRKGINGFSFAICNSKGNWIGNANSIEEIRKEYDYELKRGIIKIKKRNNNLADRCTNVQTSEPLRLIKAMSFS